ncbi:MAG: hypothetical protein ABIQ93_03605, partial [Saprospiraceae bacterium]
MNITPTQRRLAWVCTVLALLTGSSRAIAQCDIATPFSQPVQITMYLDPIGGTALLERQTVAPGIISSSCIPPYGPMRVRFYDNATKNVPAGGFINRLYSCSDVSNSPHNVWVAVNDGVNYPGSESPSVALQVRVFDITDPSVEPLPSVSVNTSDDGNTGDCTFQDAGFLNIGLTGVPKSIGLVLGAGEYTDNCLSGVVVTYDIDYDNNSVFTDLTNVLGADAGVKPFPPGVSTVTYHITDASGNTVAFSMDVSVTDDENPVVICPLDFSTSTDANFCYATVFASPQAFDNCTLSDVTWTTAGPPSTNPSSGTNDVNAPFPVGSTIVT